MINEIFEYSKSQQELIAITFYGESKFWCGIIEDYNEDFIQLRHYSRLGELDGVAIEKIANIERIDIQDEYLSAMKIIIENKDKIRNGAIKSRVFDELTYENWQYVSLKPYEKDTNVMASIQINNETFYKGFVKKISPDFIKFEIIANDGISSGLSLFKVEDITSIKINDLECRRRLVAYQQKQATQKHPAIN